MPRETKTSTKAPHATSPRDEDRERLCVRSVARDNYSTRLLFHGDNGAGDDQILKWNYRLNFV